MRIEVDYVQRFVRSESTNYREGNCVVAAHDHGQRTSRDYLLNDIGELLEVVQDVRGHYGYIAAVGHRDSCQ